MTKNKNKTNWKTGRMETKTQEPRSEAGLRERERDRGSNEARKPHRARETELSRREDRRTEKDKEKTQRLYSHLEK